MTSVLVAFPTSDGQTGKAIYDGCETCGYEVDAIDPRKAPHHLIPALNKKKYDIVLCSRTIELFPHIYRAKKMSDAKFCMWNVDERHKLAEWGTLVFMADLVDFNFVMSEGSLNRWRHINKNSFFLPQGAQIEKYHVPQVTTNERLKYGETISFIGGMTKYHQDRQEILGYLEKLDIGFQAHEGVWGNDHNIISHCSLLNIGMAHSPWVAKYHSVRDWKILAAGGVLLTRDHPGYDEFFNGFVETYLTKEECVEKINMIKNNRKHYQDKAMEAAKWVRDSQTYAHRMEEMVDIIEKNK